MTTVEDILISLDGLCSAERVLKSKTMYPTSMKVLGIMNPDLKRVLKELYHLHKSSDKQELVLLATELCNEEIIECQMLAWMLLDKTGVVPFLTKEELHKLKGVLDNWVSVDTYGTLVYGIAWRNGVISDKEVLALQQHENVWYRRLALVATVALNLRTRGGLGDSERTIKICEGAVNDKHDMIVKALSWALRSLIFWDRSSVELFMLEHENNLHKRVLREVSHKLEFGTKN